MKIVQIPRRRPNRPLRTKKVSFCVTEDYAGRMSELASRRRHTVAAYLQRLVAAGRRARAEGTGVMRPRRPQHPPRNSKMSLHVMEAEYKVLDQEAQEAGLTMSNYLLALVEIGLRVLTASSAAATKGPSGPTDRLQPSHSRLVR